MARKKTHHKRRHSVRRKGRHSMAGVAGSMIQEVLGVTAGAIIAKKVSSMMPNLDPKIAGAIKVAAGVALPKFIKNPLVAAAGQGMIAIGGVELIGSFVPSLGATDDVLVVSGIDQIGDVSEVNGINEVNGLDEIGDVDEEY